MLPALRAAVGDLSWLLSRGYTTPSALKLVGDRYTLTERQRIGVARCACSDAARAGRAARCADVEAATGAIVFIDGYNLLTTIEAALGHGVILAARDSAYRDMASMHGTWRKVAETGPALALIGQRLAELGCGEAVWYFDSPVSNSGRLKTLVRETAQAHGWNWTVELVKDPDPVLIESSGLVVSADSAILDGCTAWLNLARDIIARSVPAAHVVDLSELGPTEEDPTKR
jgi:hypothetical protein